MIVAVMGLVALAGLAADPAWPSDFSSRMAMRIAETTPIGTAATLASASAPVVLFAGGIASSEPYGDESEPFDSWFMTYGMPILFFFILYSAPSGLLLYWSTQNLLSMIQQFYTNRKLKKNPNSLEKPKAQTEEKVPEAVRKYQEKLKRLEEEKARLAKEQAKGKKKK